MAFPNEWEHGRRGMGKVVSMTPEEHVSPAAVSAANVLRRAIQSGDLSAGQHVRQEIWAERLRTSRAPVREALRILETEGLVTHDRHRGYFVKEWSRDEIEQLYRMRALIEPEVLRTVEWPDETALATLRKLADESTEAMRADAVTVGMAKDQEFTWMVWDLSPKNLIVKTARDLWVACDLVRAMVFRHMTLSSESIDLHRDRFERFLHALEHQDREALISVASVRIPLLAERIGYGLRP